MIRVIASEINGNGGHAKGSNKNSLIMVNLHRFMMGEGCFYGSRVRGSESITKPTLSVAFASSNNSLPKIDLFYVLQ